MNHDGAAHEHNDDDVGKSDEHRTEKLIRVLMGIVVFMGCRPVPKLVLSNLANLRRWGYFLTHANRSESAMFRHKLQPPIQGFDRIRL